MCAKPRLNQKQISDRNYELKEFVEKGRYKIDL